MKNNKFVWIILVPVFLQLLVFFVGPMLGGFVISMFNYNPLRNNNAFIGLENFIHITSDPLFFKSLVSTLIFVGVTVSLNIAITLIIAQLISVLPWNSMRSLFRAIFFMPCVAPLVATSIVWSRSIFSTRNGLLNIILDKFGIPAVNWIGSADTVMVSLILFTLWADMGYNIIIFSAGIDNIPHDFHEAAQIDGAGPISRFISITIPLLGRTFSFVTAMTIISHFQMFAQFMVLTKGVPNNSSKVLTLYIYNMGFVNKDMGYASTIAIALFGLIMIITLVQQRLNRIEWGY